MRLWTMMTMAAILTIAAAPTQAAVFVNAQIAQAGVGGRIGGTPFERSDDDLAVAPQTIAATAAFRDMRSDAQGNAISLRGSSSVDALLLSAERGRVTFRQALAVDGVAADLGDTIGAAGSYVYLFNTDAPTLFELNWGVSTSATPAGADDIAQVAWLRDRNAATFAFYTDPLTNGADGTLSAVIGPGSYELHLQGAEPAVAQAANARASLGSQYSFAMSAAPVPEPETWALMTLGFAALGGALRRRRAGARTT